MDDDEITLAMSYMDVLVTLLSSHDGGRLGPAAPGYRPHLLFDAGSGTCRTSVTLWFEGDQWVEPGGSGRARLFPIRPDLVLPMLAQGGYWLLAEGTRITGYFECLSGPHIQTQYVPSEQAE